MGAGYVDTSYLVQGRAARRRVMDFRGSGDSSTSGGLTLANFAWSAVGLTTGSKCRVYSGLFIVDGRGMWRWPDASSAYDDISVTGNGWIYGYTTRTSPAKPTKRTQPRADLAISVPDMSGRVRRDHNRMLGNSSMGNGWQCNIWGGVMSWARTSEHV
jgi:hypothetical protein